MHKTFSNLASDLSITTLHMFVLFCCNAKWVNLSLGAQCVYFMLQVASLSLLNSNNNIDDYCNAGPSSPPGNRL